MTRSRRLLRYGGLPLLAAFLPLLLYYGGAPGVRNVVSPPAGERWDWAWESGLLENAQNAMLLASAALFAIGAWRGRRLWPALLAAGTLFVLGEEVDWGGHWGGGGASIHNREGMLSPSQRAFKWGVVGFFGVFPLVARRLRAWAPDRFSPAGVLVAFAAWKAARMCRDAGLAAEGTLRGNEGEFFEIACYCLVLLYALDLRRRQSGPPAV